jgi:hypothetical protein
MSHRIEMAKSGRSLCVTCGEKIAKGETRVAELYQDSQHGPVRYMDQRTVGGDYYRVRDEGREAIHRFHHLACAAKAQPIVLASALRAPHDPALIPDRAALDRQVAGAVEAERKARVDAAAARIGVRDEATAVDERLEALLARLIDNPDDLDGLSIVGDHLSEKGEPHGEMIAIQLALRDVKVERAPDTAGRTLGGRGIAVRSSPRDREVVDTKHADLLNRYSELMASVAPRLDTADRKQWGVGFVQRLELGKKSCERLVELGKLWRHTAMRLLTELRLELLPRFAQPELRDQFVNALPKSLRRLEIGPHYDSDLSKIVAALPRLQHLAFLAAWNSGGHSRPKHPTVTEVAFHGSGHAGAIELLSHDDLPALRSIAVHEWWKHDPLVELSRSGLLTHLERVHLERGDQESITDASVAALRKGLGKRKLPRLEIVNIPITLPIRAALAELCVELECPAASVVLDADTTHVTHANKPEWGRGTIVKRTADKLEVEFPKIGVKVFKANAPFLVPA